MVKFQPIFAPRKEPFPQESEVENGGNFQAFLQGAFDPTTCILIGAVLQTLLFSSLPFRYAVAPPLLLAAALLVDTLLQTLEIIPNRYMKGVVAGRTVAQLPSFSSGKFSNRPSSEKVVVFLLGARCNHPLGLFAPNFKQLGDYFDSMLKSATANTEKFGLLGTSQWNSPNRQQVMILFYFKSTEGLNDFAKSDAHVEGVRWWSKVSKEGTNRHIGIMHETYEVPAGNWETIYENYQPTCMGAVSVNVKDEETEEQSWVRPLFSMGKGQFKTQYGRMGRTDGTDNEKYAEDGFW